VARPDGQEPGPERAFGVVGGEGLAHAQEHLVRGVPGLLLGGEQPRAQPRQVGLEGAEELAEGRRVARPGSLERLLDPGLGHASSPAPTNEPGRPCARAFGDPEHIRTCSGPGGRTRPARGSRRGRSRRGTCGPLPTRLSSETGTSAGLLLEAPREGGDPDAGGEVLREAVVDRVRTAPESDCTS
jgi:hypothetical protein